MTPRTWAEDKLAKAVTGYHWNGRRRKSTVTLPSIAAKLLLNEHARSVRIVKQYYKRYGTEGSPCELICNDILAALQRGRTGRGK